MTTTQFNLASLKQDFTFLTSVHSILIASFRNMKYTHSFENSIKHLIRAVGRNPFIPSSPNLAKISAYVNAAKLSFFNMIMSAPLPSVIHGYHSQNKTGLLFDTKFAVDDTLCLAIVDFLNSQHSHKQYVITSFSDTQLTFKVIDNHTLLYLPSFTFSVYCNTQLTINEIFDLIRNIYKSEYNSFKQIEPDLVEKTKSLILEKNLTNAEIAMLKDFITLI